MGTDYVDQISAAGIISDLLPDGWSVGSDNPNTFYSNKLECLYVYNTSILYWEDKRARHISTRIKYSDNSQLKQALKQLGIIK